MIGNNVVGHGELWDGNHNQQRGSHESEDGSGKVGNRISGDLSSIMTDESSRRVSSLCVYVRGGYSG